MQNFFRQSLAHMPLKTDVPEPPLTPVQDMQFRAKLLCMLKLHLGLPLSTEAPAVTHRDSK